jgi:ribosomal 50S subunit-recycling heat shock protein
VTENGKVFSSQENSYPRFCVWLKITKFFYRRTRTQDFVTENGKVFFPKENSYPRFCAWLKITKFFHRRTRTQDFVTKNGKVFLRRTHTQDLWMKITVFFSGKVVPNIWWVQILHENSYPKIVEYDFSRRSGTRVRPGTTSPGEIVSRYDFSRRNRTQFFLGTSSPGYDFSWVQITRVIEGIIEDSCQCIVQTVEIHAIRPTIFLIAAQWCY